MVNKELRMQTIKKQNLDWCFWTVVLEKTLGSPLDSKEIKPVNPKGNQSWLFIGRNGAEAEAPVLRPPDAKHWLIKNKSVILSKKLKAGGSGDDRGWEGWMKSSNWWTWVWASFGNWWGTGKPGVMWSMGSQRIGHNWASELNNKGSC